MVQPFTVIVLADVDAPPPDPVLLELDTDPLPAWTWTLVPPAEELLETLPAPLETVLPVPLEPAPADEMLPSAFFCTVTVQV